VSDPEPPVRVVDRRWWARAESEPSAESENEPTTKPGYVADLERRLAEQDARVREVVARHEAASQEIENARQRLRRESSKDIERAKRTVLASFLDVVDNLDRAIGAARHAGEHATDHPGLLEGIEMVRRQFLETLKRHGVEPIDAAGAAFDPTVHDAVSMVPVGESSRAGHVVDVVKPGYRIDDDVLRPASVTVGQASLEESSETPA